MNNIKIFLLKDKLNFFISFFILLFFLIYIWNNIYYYKKNNISNIPDKNVKINSIKSDNSAFKTSKIEDNYIYNNSKNAPYSISEKNYNSISYIDLNKNENKENNKLISNFKIEQELLTQNNIYKIVEELKFKKDLITFLDKTRIIFYRQDDKIFSTNIWYLINMLNNIKLSDITIINKWQNIVIDNILKQNVNWWSIILVKDNFFTNIINNDLLKKYLMINLFFNLKFINLENWYIMAYIW